MLELLVYLLQGMQKYVYIHTLVWTRRQYNVCLYVHVLIEFGYVCIYMRTYWLLLYYSYCFIFSSMVDQNNSKKYCRHQLDLSEGPKLVQMIWVPD